MYKVYKVVRTDVVDYDQYDSCVVIAENEEEAFKMANEEYYIFTRENVDIIEIKLDKAQAILGSFNAG